jgi:hypothetical protein
MWFQIQASVKVKAVGYNPSQALAQWLHDLYLYGLEETLRTLHCKDAVASMSCLKNDSLLVLEKAFACFSLH